MAVRYICVNCGFKSTTKKIPARCPYCAKADGLRDNQLGQAQKLLNDLDE